jgi:4'-phosphopantetheinyl transferase
VIHWLVCPAEECPALRSGTPPGDGPPPDFLSPSERQAYAHFRFDKRRREWLLGRWTAKRLLRLSDQAYRDLELNAISVGNDPDGAPFLSVQGKGRLPLSLSISHRQERAFSALCASFPVGADIERVEAHAPSFVRDYFTAQEAERVFSAPPQMRNALATVIWSAKEAVLKAVRLGLRVDTRAVEVCHVQGMEQDQGAEELSLDPEAWYEMRIATTLPDTSCFVAWWRPDGDYVLTLAVLSP